MPELTLTDGQRRVLDAARTGRPTVRSISRRLGTSETWVQCRIDELIACGAWDAPQAAPPPDRPPPSRQAGRGRPNRARVQAAIEARNAAAQEARVRQVDPQTFRPTPADVSRELLQQWRRRKGKGVPRA